MSNIYLHEVLDEWFVQQVKPRMSGKAEMVRFADDAVLLFERREDLERVMEVLPKRFAKYGLTMNERKTSAIRFLPPGRRDGGKPEPVNFLGFTHYRGKSRRGNWVVKRKTQKERLARAVTTVAEWCKRHRPNSRSLQAFREQVKRVWFKWLNRRSRTRREPGYLQSAAQALSA